MHVSRFRIFYVMSLVLCGLMFFLPNVLSPRVQRWWPTFFPQERIHLGLDLQGGAQILLEANIEEALGDRLLAIKDTVRSALVKNKTPYKNLHIINSETGIPQAVSVTLDTLEPLHDIGDDLVQKKQGSELIIALSPERVTSITKNIMEKSVDIVSRRINELGTKEPCIQRQGERRILVQIPGISDSTQVKNILGKTARLTFHMVAAQGRKPLVGTKVFSYAKYDEGDEITVDAQPLLSGENLESAHPSVDEHRRPCIAFSFDTQGARKFADITRKNIGKQFAIILDNKVLVAPVINTAIPGGQGIITGNYTFQEVHDTALLMRSGALLAPLTVLEERSIGPSLGADSIKLGMRATVIAILLVAGVMVMLYGAYGMLANISLCVNLILLIGALSALGATLTLSGIAGIALTVGMAVDANVLIFERIKEERRKNNLIQSIHLGFKEAMSTIIDSNITTLIGAALLFQFGTGLLRGFAVTLSLGIVISMFTAISLTHILVITYHRMVHS